MSEFLLRHWNFFISKVKGPRHLPWEVNQQKDWRTHTHNLSIIYKREDRRFGLFYLHERNHICKIANLGHLLSSDIGAMMQRKITHVA
jgi:hypothetical protein